MADDPRYTHSQVYQIVWREFLFLQDSKKDGNVSISYLNLKVARLFASRPLNRTTAHFKCASLKLSLDRHLHTECGNSRA